MADSIVFFCFLWCVVTSYSSLQTADSPVPFPSSILADPRSFIDGGLMGNDSCFPGYVTSIPGSSAHG